MRLLALLALVSCWGEPPEAPPPPLSLGETSVLLIIIDTLRADHLPSWGYEHDTAPHLTRLGEQGVVFEQVYSASSWTRPGVAGMLTGLHPRRLGVLEERYDRLPEEALTLAELLSSHGYRTLGVNSNPNLNVRFGFEQGFEVYEDPDKVWPWMEGGESEQPSLPDAAAVSDRALELLEQHHESGAPWYLQLVYLDPHSPYTPPPEHLRAVRGSDTPEYDGEIRYADAEIHRLLTALRERGLMENTLLVVSSDHGEGLKSYPDQARASFHGDHLYEGHTRVPWLLHHPALSPRRVTQLASGLDLTPTLLDLLAAPPLPQSDGRSLAGPARGESAEAEPRWVVSETHWQASEKLALRSSEHHYILHRDVQRYARDGSHEGEQLSRSQRAMLEGPPEELFLVEDGQAGTQSLSSHSAVEMYRSWLERWSEETALGTPQGRNPRDVLVTPNGPVYFSDEEPPEPLRPETLRQLKALGYLGD